MLRNTDLVNLVSSRIFVCQLRNLWFFSRDVALVFSGLFFFDLYIRRPHFCDSVVVVEKSSKRDN